MKLTNQEPRVRGLQSSGALTSFIPISEIRRRVGRIKQKWTPDVARARAAEGDRRRGELETLLQDILQEDLQQLADCDQGSEFSCCN